MEKTCIKNVQGSCLVPCAAASYTPPGMCSHAGGINWKYTILLFRVGLSYRLSCHPAYILSCRLACGLSCILSCRLAFLSACTIRFLQCLVNSGSRIFHPRSHRFGRRPRSFTRYILIHITASLEYCMFINDNCSRSNIPQYPCRGSQLCFFRRIYASDNLAADDGNLTGDMI